MDLKEALGKLDAGNDNHWTTDGLPRIESVKFISGNPNITRDQINTAWLGFNRNVARDPSTAVPFVPPVETVDETSSTVATDEMPPVQIAIAPVQAVQLTGVSIVPEQGTATAPTGNTAQVHEFALEGLVANLLSLDDVQKYLSELDRAQVQLNIERRKVEMLHDRLVVQQQDGADPYSNQGAICDYLKTQQATATRRGEQMVIVRKSGVDLKELQRQISGVPLDVMLRSRKRAP